MRKIEDIQNNERITSIQMSSVAGAYTGIVYNGKRSMHFVLGTDEGGWEHVSLSFCNELLFKRGELPSWLEMAMVKDIFWDDEEEVYQIHPPKSEYVNIAEVLHLWRPKNGRRIFEIV